MRLGFPSEPEIKLTARAESENAGADIWVTVEVRAGSLSGNVTSMVDRKAWADFLGELSVLETKRQGEVLLASALPSELSVRIYADSTGHMGADVEIQTRRIDVGAALTILQVSAIGFEATDLKRLLDELEAVAA